MKAKRKYSHRGCSNCKKSSIKCDEIPTGCLNCNRKRWKCEYENKLFVYQPDQYTKRKRFKKVKWKEQAIETKVSPTNTFGFIGELIDIYKEYSEERNHGNELKIDHQMLDCKSLDEASMRNHLRVPEYVQHWKPYNKKRCDELEEKLDARGTRKGNSHFHEYDAEVQEFIFHYFISTKAVYNFILVPDDEDNCISRWFLLFAPNYSIIGLVVNAITCNLLDIRCSDNRWLCIMQRNMSATLDNLSKRVGECNSFAEMSCYLMSIMFLFSERSATSLDIWRLHLRGAHAILEKCDTLHKYISNVGEKDTQTENAIHMFCFAKNWFVSCETIACLSAPNGGAVKNVESLKKLLGYTGGSPQDGFLVGGFNLIKCYSQLLTPVFVEVILFIINFKSTTGILLTGSEGILQDLQYFEELKSLGEDLVNKVQAVEAQELDLLSIKDHVLRAYMKACNKAYCCALKIYIWSVFLGKSVYGAEVQRGVQTIEEQLVTMHEIMRYGLRIHWPLFIAALCAPPGNQRKVLMDALTSISSNGTFVAQNTVNRVQSYWDIIDKGGVIQEKEFDSITM